MRRFGFIALIVVIVAMALVGSYVFRDPVLVVAGKFLERTDKPFSADVIIVIRGDEVYFNRALTAAQLFHEGLAPRIYVSSALDDLAAPYLAARGVIANKMQDNIARVLNQSHVPCDRILLDSDQPGGGTPGEVNRIRAMLAAQGYSSALVVTSWYHTRRLHVLLEAALKNSKISLAIIAADEPTNAANWWRRRYIAIAVLEEYMKLIIAWLPFQPRFGDDAVHLEAHVAAPRC
jgi:uncharacterized SAM-binding protein YcdF (DUF218 family)